MSERSQNARAEHEVRRLLRRSHPLSDVPDGRDDRGIYEWREHVPRRRASPVRSLRWMRRRHERGRPACTSLAYGIVLFSGVHTNKTLIYRQLGGISGLDFGEWSHEITGIWTG